MSDERYARAQVIAHAALERLPTERTVYLDVACGSDTALRQEVEWLIETASDTALDEVPELVTAVAGQLTKDLRIDASTLGHYRLIERIGEGGMGVVWLAERDVGGARQRVALKRLRLGSLTEHARFKEEQRILATLNHPNIARLVDAGADAEHVPFLAMEYVEGVCIDRWCDSQHLDARARVALFIKVCSAVSYAHERLIIHRDLKPANILVDASGEPKLLDFGIAKLLDTEATLATATKAMTPAYASPEQISGKPLGTSSDVWSLGVVLYELLAGQRPFAHLDNAHEVASAIVSGVVKPPSRHVTRGAVPGGRKAVETSMASPPRIPGDLDAIVLKALRREPEQRYASVRELAEDLDRFLQARPVNAQHGQWGYHARLFLKRNRWPLSAGIALFALASAFTWRTLLAEREARLQAQVAERSTEFLVSTFSLSNPENDRHDFTAREVLDRGLDRINDELKDQPRVRARLLEALGNAYRGINEGNAGVQLLESAAQLYQSPVVNDPVAASRSLRTKALAIKGAGGSTADAERAARQAHDLLMAHSDDRLLLAESYAALALTLNANGNEQEAISAAHKALALREAANAGAPLLAKSQADLCSVIGGAGEYSRALAYCKKAQALHVESGTTHTNDYRLLLGEIVGLLKYVSDYETSLQVARERLALTRSLFGERSAVLARERVVLAVSLAESGVYEEAVALLSEGTTVILRKHGKNSARYAWALFSAGLIEYERGNFIKAEHFLRESHSIYVSAVGGNDRHFLQVIRVVWATALIASGHADPKARSLLESVMEVRASFDVADVALAYARLPLAQWHVINGELAKAEALLVQVEAVGKRVELELHARSAATRAFIMHANGNLQGALRFHQSAYEIAKRDRGSKHPRVAYYAINYANALRLAGETGKAQSLEREYRELGRIFMPAWSVATSTNQASSTDSI